MSAAKTQRRPIYVAGTGATGPVPEDPRSIVEMVLDAVGAALADARATYADIDAVVTASVDMLDGLTASNIAVTEVVGAVMKPETRISADGLAAALHAACQIWSGAYDTVLVVAHAKASMADVQTLTRWACDPVHLQPLGVDFLACAGLQAHVMAANDPSAEQRWVDVAVKRRQAGGGVFPGPRTTAEILASPVVASPLRAGMCAPLGDAACAVVLTAGPPIVAAPRLTGAGWDLDAHALGDRDLGRWDGLARAFRRACQVAGVAPADMAFDLAEPSCFHAHEEELFLAATGVATASISPTGGLFAGTAPVVAGLSRLAAAARSLRGQSGLGRALAHGCWGPAGQGQAVAFLEAA